MEKALIHMVNGDKIGAFVYKDGIENGEVQPITLNKDNVKKYYSKLLTTLPAHYKGKPPIGKIDISYQSNADILPLSEEVEDMGSSSFKRFYPKDVPADIAYNKEASAQDLEYLDRFIPNTSAYDTYSNTYKYHVSDLNKKITGDPNNRQDMKKIIGLINVAKNQWGTKWSEKLHNALASNKNKVFQQVIEKPKAASEPKKSAQTGQASQPEQQEIPVPIKSPSDTHYHYDNKKIDFSSEDLNAALQSLDNQSPHGIVYKIPELHNKFKETFGPNWATLLSVAQRLNRYKAKGLPNAVDQVEREYKNSLITAFGKDWKENFNKIQNSLTNATMVTQLDPSLDEKEKKLATKKFDYAVGANQYSPDLKYLKDIAVPSLIDYSDGYLIDIDKSNPSLASDLTHNLGPYWRDLVSMAKTALKQKQNGVNPFTSFIQKISNNKPINMAFQSKFGPDYVKNALDMISAITDEEIPENIKNFAGDYKGEEPQQVQAQAPSNPPQDPSGQAQQVDPNMMQQPDANIQTQQDLPVQPQSDPNVQQDPNVQPTTDQSQPVQDPNTEVQTQPDLPTQSDANPESNVETSTPIDSQDGSVPQSSTLRADPAIKTDEAPPALDLKTTEQPTIPAPEEDKSGNIRYINKEGDLATLNRGQIQKALAIDLFANADDKTKEKEIKNILGASWKSLYAHIHLASDLIKAGKDPKVQWETGYGSSPKLQEKLKNKIGPDWKNLLGLIATEVANIVNSVKTN